MKFHQQTIKNLFKTEFATEIHKKKQLKPEFALKILKIYGSKIQKTTKKSKICILSQTNQNKPI